MCERFCAATREALDLFGAVATFACEEGMPAQLSDQVLAITCDNTADMTLKSYLNESMTLTRLSHDQTITFFPLSSGGVFPRSSFLTCNPTIGMPSCRAHFISHRAPVDCMVFLLIKTITPSQDFIFVLHFCRHIFGFHGVFTDISTNENGVFSFFACATKKFLYFLSSIAKLMKILFLESSESSNNSLIKSANAPAPIIAGHILFNVLGVSG